MKRPTTLVEALLRQAALDLDLSVERDIEVIRRRSKHEGLSFLTITLPVLSDNLERGLEAGFLSLSDGFTRHGSLPRLLGGFFRKVFTKDGRLLPDPCGEAIYWIRQISRFMKKLKIPCTPKREAKAIEHFLEVEGELRYGTSQVEREDNVLDSISGIIWSRVFPETDYTDLVCHHGPGVTADRYHSNERNRIRKWNSRSEYSYPSDLHCFPNYGVAAEWSGRNGAESSEVLGIEYLSIREELPVRVVFVPKTQTSPRVIAIEPSHVQFMQQSLKDYMYEELEKHRLTKRSIRFIRQDVNQRLAYRSSIDKRLATLDLKDASDRVHLHLVQRIFKTSGILEFLEDARSLHATLPNGKNIVLWKFASMGSALCFPVEAMVFYTLIQSAMHKLDGIRPSSRSIEKYSHLIDIYGDDIIVPVEYSDTVVRYLESYLLKVNVSKSFKESYFRESCGADYWKGISVKPVYARTVPYDNARDWGAEEVLSWNATADIFYMEGKWVVAQAIRQMLRQVVKRRIPRSRQPGSGLFHFSYLFDTNLHWNADTCGWKQKRIQYTPSKQKDNIDGDEIACLNKWGQRIVQREKRGTVAPDLSNSAGHRPMGDVSVGRGYVPENGYSFAQRGVRYEAPDTDAWFRDRGLCKLPCHKADETGEFPDFSAMAGVGNGRDKSRDQPSTERFDFGPDYCLTEVESDPLGHLHGDSFGMDVLSSVKRGCFKSKSRWTSLLS